MLKSSLRGVRRGSAKMESSVHLRVVYLRCMNGVPGCQGAKVPACYGHGSDTTLLIETGTSISPPQVAASCRSMVSWGRQGGREENKVGNGTSRLIVRLQLRRISYSHNCLPTGV